MRLLVSEQRDAIISALSSIKESGRKLNFISLDMRNVLREHCDATTDGIHYARDKLQGELFTHALALMMNGCVDNCDWVQVQDF